MLRRCARTPGGACTRHWPSSTSGSPDSTASWAFESASVFVAQGLSRRTAWRLSGRWICASPDCVGGQSTTTPFADLRNFPRQSAAFSEREVLFIGSTRPSVARPSGGSENKRKTEVENWTSSSNFGLTSYLAARTSGTTFSIRDPRSESIRSAGARKQHPVRTARRHHLREGAPHRVRCRSKNDPPHLNSDTIPLTRVGGISIPVVRVPWSSNLPVRGHRIGRATAHHARNKGNNEKRSQSIARLTLPAGI